MNYAKIIDTTNIFFKEQVTLRKREAQSFYNKMTILFILISFSGYLATVYFSSQMQGIAGIFSDYNLTITISISLYLGASLYYLMTLLHDYVHASQYYSEKASFLMEYVVPILVPMNPCGYRWTHFQHHLNTNRFSEELDTLPPFKLEKTLKAFWFNVFIHSLFIMVIFIVRIIVSPLTIFSKEKGLIYFNYISPLGRVSPNVYPKRKSKKEFEKNFTGNLITLISLLIFWACSGFSLVFWAIYLTSLLICSVWIAFRSLVDHACVDVKGKEEVTVANFHLTSNFSNNYFWYAGFATYHLIHHINPNIPHYFCQEINDILCREYPEYQKLHQRRNNLPLVIRDFFAKDVIKTDLLKSSVSATLKALV